MLALFSALTITRLASEKLSELMPTRMLVKSEKRFKGLMENIDAIAADSNQKTLFLGTSIYKYFLDPREYDAKVKENGVDTKSYNLSFEGSVGSSIYSMTQRLRAEFLKRNARFKTVVFELSPACFNKTFYRNHRLMVDFTYPKIFLDDSTWQKMLIQNTPDASYLLLNQELKPFNWDFFPYRRFFGFAKAAPLKWPGIAGIWSHKAFYEVPEWNPETSGYVNWNLPHSEDDFNSMQDRLHEKENWDHMIFKYREGNGIYPSFGFEPNLVKYYIEAVKEASQFAENVYLVILPYAPAFQRPVNKFVDKNYIISKMTNETGATVIDYTDALPVTDLDFADAMHLRKETMNRFLTLLAERIASDQKIN